MSKLIINEKTVMYNEKKNIYKIIRHLFAQYRIQWIAWKRKEMKCESFLIDFICQNLRSIDNIFLSFQILTGYGSYFSDCLRLYIWRYGQEIRIQRKNKTKQKTSQCKITQISQSHCFKHNWNEEMYIHNWYFVSFRR